MSSKSNKLLLMHMIFATYAYDIECQGCEDDLQII